MTMTRALVLLSGLTAALASAAGRPDGGAVADFTLTDPREPARPVRLADFKDRKAVVVVFLGTECPVNNLYLPTLARLSRDYAGKGVAFLGVNANVNDNPAAVATHARKNAIPFPVLKDGTGAVAAAFGAERTPEAFVLDADRHIRYRGRIDDQFAVNVRRPQPVTHDLANALDELLAGKTPTKTHTEVVGCYITRPRQPKADATVTFAKDVAPILQQNCQECHRPGQIGPFPLLTHADAAAWSETIRQEVEANRMPPWYADPKIGHFSNDRRLPDVARQTLLAWIDQGCPKGDDKDLPPAKSFPEGWRIGTPDAVFTMTEEYSVPAEAPPGGIAYQYFLIDPKFTEDRWVERAEAKAGATAVVHHIVAFVLPPKNANEPTPPGPPVLPLPITSEAAKATVLCGTAPGDMPLILPPGYAKKIPAGAKIILQMHYTPNGTAQKDRSTIALIFAKKPPQYRVRSIPVFNERVRIPPGEANYRLDAMGPINLHHRELPVGFADDGVILGFMPHMHLRGKGFFVEAVYPDQKRVPLLSVPHFNFNWQNVYRLQEPLRVPAGTRIHCVAHYDNSPDNPNNPDPQATVTWGDQTWEEMMIGWMDMAYVNEKR